MPLKATLLLFALLLQSGLAGTVTLVTHGMDSNAKTWVTDMCLAIQKYQQNRGFESDVFYAELPQQSTVLATPQFIVKPLTTSSSNTDRNIIIAFDWSFYAGSLFAITVDHPTWVIAPLVKSFLMRTNPLPGFSEPLAWRSLHLVGHSRGGSLLSGVCDHLATNDILVAHLTTLDPRAHPIASDIDPHVATNVLFADNYFQTYDSLTYGSYMDGAYNRKPVLYDYYVPQTPPIPSVRDGHTAIHNWYHRTIGPLALPGDSVMQGFYKQWFSPEDEAGAKTGYYFEFSPNGVRPLDGYRTRRLGHPRLFMIDAADGTNTFFGVGGGATGKYFFDVSPDLIRWVSITNAILLDGRPYIETNSVDSLSSKLIYFRLHSVNKQF